VSIEDDSYFKNILYIILLFGKLVRHLTLKDLEQLKQTENLCWLVIIPEKRFTTDHTKLMAVNDEKYDNSLTEHDDGRCCWRKTVKGGFIFRSVLLSKWFHI